METGIINQMVTTEKRKRGRPKGWRKVKTEAAPAQSPSIATEPDRIEPNGAVAIDASIGQGNAGNGQPGPIALTGTWERKKMDSLGGYIYASFDTEQGFYASPHFPVNRSVKIHLLGDGNDVKSIKEIVVHNVRDVKPNDIKMKWPMRAMSKKWLYEGKDPFYAGAARQNKPLAAGVSIVSVEAGK